MNYEEISSINQNPFLGGILLGHFLSGCINKEIDFAMIYLLFPVIYKRESRDILYKANVRSTLDSLFYSGRNNNKATLGGIEKRFYYFKDLTNNSLIVAASDLGVIVSDKITIDIPFSYAKETNVSMKTFYRAAFRFGQVLSKVKVNEAYIKLGIRYV